MQELAYNPHFEAISPTPNEESRASPLQSEKDEILNNINSIDREIVKVENIISSLSKRAVSVGFSSCATEFDAENFLFIPSFLLLVC